MRRGFGLITAMIILVTVSSLMAMMISLSSASVKQTADIYFKEQAELLARSAVEYGLLAISGHENNVSCIENVNISYLGAYDTNLTFYYLYAGATVPACNNVLASGLMTPESNLTAIIDVRVSVNQTVTGISEPIVIHRRTIQKP